MRTNLALGAFIVLCILGVFGSLHSAQIKELASVVGVRENQLIGYGLVVGLNGTGDGTSNKFTIQSISNMLQTVNVKVSVDDIKSKNTAAVMVTGRLPAFARQGDNIDVTVSSIGDAKNLTGGTLLLTALKGVDGEIYALANGALNLGGDAGKKSGKHPTVATIIGGGTVEKELIFDLSDLNSTNLSLKNSNFSTALNMQNAIKKAFGERAASAIDPRTIRLNRPANMPMVEFLAGVMELDMGYKSEQKVIIDERTGTVISGVGIAVEPVIISHGAITIKIEPNSYQPSEAQNPLDIGDAAIDTTTSTLKIGGPSVTVSSVARALNRLGASPQEIIAILENLKRAGAITAKVEVI